MVDLQTLVIGALGTLATLAILKIVDSILAKVFDFAVFSRIWFWASKSIKKFLTRLKPIRIHFEFSTAIEPTDNNKVKSTMEFLTEGIAKKQLIKLSPVSWNADSSEGITNIQYHERDFFLKITPSSNVSSPSLIEEGDEYLEADLLSSEGICFDIETRFSFNELEQMLLSLGSLINLIKEEMKETLLVTHFSVGVFTLEPIKGKITIDEWIKKKNFEMSILLKGKDSFSIRLYPRKAEIIFPSLQIDEKVLDYLRETILNYYF